jgi:hypothetical protein
MRDVTLQVACAERTPIAHQDLSRFRFHTGATLRRLGCGETCPILFRDVGPQALARFLRGELRRLAGPTSPILYLRTSAYEEPYVDYERTGRLAFLQPQRLGPWHSGVSQVFVASADHLVDSVTVGFVPGNVPLELAGRMLADVRDIESLREAFGGSRYDEGRAESLECLDSLERECARAERLAEPIRRALQSGQRRPAEEARAWMERCQITDHDLCAAWHHLPPERRQLLREVLPAFPSERLCR